MAEKRKRYFRELKDVRLELAEINHQLQTGELSESKAKTIKELLNGVIYAFKTEAMIENNSRELDIKEQEIEELKQFNKVINEAKKEGVI